MSAHSVLQNILDTDSTIPDPGPGQTIVVDRSPAICEMESAAGESRGMAMPIKSGLIVTLTLKTDGGDVLVVFDEGFNAADNNVLTFDDAGDTAMFVSVPLAASDTGYVWRLMGNVGCTASA